MNEEREYDAPAMPNRPRANTCASRQGRGLLARRLCSLALAGASGLLLPASLRAQDKLDPGAKTPYDVQVVLHIVENRFLTPLFQDQLQKDVQSRLQTALGKMGKVQVARTHRLLADIEAQGLGPVLDGWDELTGQRTCFVLLDYAAGSFRLAVRQHDGLTALPTPLVRRRGVNDQARVAQAIVEMIQGDFGLVGTVEAAEDQDRKSVV
jgi:hypothetical protein